MQNIRSAMQKHLKSVMGTTGATFVRFGFGIPFACLYWVILNSAFDMAAPQIHGKFLFWTALASLAQIGGTFLLIHLFSFRNFAVGSAYSRTEPAQTAVFALLVLGEKISTGAVAAIAISIIGLMIISVARTAITIRSFATSLMTRTALLGLTSGTFFGIAAASYREAALSLDNTEFLMQAATTLCVAIIFQSAVMLVWIILREPDELKKIARAWKPSLAVGFFGASASFGWFAAFTLQAAALVKVLAQVEMIFTFLSTVFVFKENINRAEIMGCLFITIGVVVLVLT